MRLHRFVEYHCRSCNAQCLNDRRDAATRYRECKDCHRLPILDQRPIDHLLPSLYWFSAFDLDACPADASAGKAERRAPPSEATGSDPSRVDPEAGAQGPTVGTDPTTPRGKPQRRLSDFTALPDGGRRD